MGCLNDSKKFAHKFANVHLSGPCNRSCYFCIGQHMLGLDHLNVLDTWPLPNIDKFVDQLIEQDIKIINITGSNTEPLMFKHLEKYVEYIRSRIPDAYLGIRTNGALANNEKGIERLRMFDEVSISIASYNEEIYKKIMGRGTPPNIKYIVNGIRDKVKDIKANIILLPEVFQEIYKDDTIDLEHTIINLYVDGIKKINLREPYGQPHVGDPLASRNSIPRNGSMFNMPKYKLSVLGPVAEILYWDVHYVEVTSYNLYASGRISTDYSVTKGHAENGKVIKQDEFTEYKRHFPQWQYKTDK